MLTNLSIKNFAIIEELNIDFRNGMTVFTGETGAGKSIIIDAINLLLGNRGNSEWIKKGHDKAILQAVFNIENKQYLQAMLKEYDIEFDNEIIVSRVITKDGRSKARINNMYVPLSFLKSTSIYLVDIHSQHDNNYMFNSKYHISFLDDYCGDNLKHFLFNYKDKFENYKKIEKEYLSLLNNDFSEAEIEFLQFQLNEINEADVKENEEDELQSIRKKLLNVEKVKNNLTKINNYVNGNNNIKDMLYDSLKSSQQISSIDNKYEKISDILNDLYYRIEDVSELVKDEIYNLDFDGYNLDDIETRLFTIQKIKRKNGGSYESIQETKLEFESKIEQYYNREANLNKLLEQKNIIYNEAYEIANEISNIRQEFAYKLEEMIQDELSDLYMKNVLFKVKFTKTFDNENIILLDNGFDKVEFMISTNLGEDLKPLIKIASGGEMSRIMLAIKKILSDNKLYSTIIFDEIDTGVSGQVASAIGNKIKILSKNIQIFSITHLPQVASLADQHIYVYKDVYDNKTNTNVKYLSDKEKIDSIAKMISGEELSDTAKKYAKELISD